MRDVLELLGITGDDIRTLRESSGNGIDTCKRDLIRERIKPLLEKVPDPATRTILTALVYRAL